MADTRDPKNAANGPDVMNDPSYDPDAIGRPRKNMDEIDTCRICRAEASVEEPLFYPCKCSGSIKFVHQNCLMEWLSHSQKKHCELCKTPFRFTKLYHPQMPSSVPTLVFLRQVVIHTWRSLIAWSRMNIVVFVWLGWLPWSMRTIWRGLFWIGDGGWINWTRLEEEALTAARDHAEKLATEGVSPVIPSFFLSRNNTASIVISRLAGALPRMASPTLNLTQGEPIVFSLATRMLRTVMGIRPDNDTISNSQIAPFNASHVPRLPHRASWLSESLFLQTLSRWPMLNNLVIDMLEGLLITVFLVVAFILIFLIREWVVQQQPGVDIPAAIEAQEPILAIEDRNDRLDAPLEELGDVEANNDETGANIEDRNHDDSPPQGASSTNAVEEPERFGGSSSESAHGDVSNASSGSQEDRTGNQETPDYAGRPSLPERGRLARAAEIRRTIEEQSRATGQDWPGVKILMDLWTRADGSPTEVLRIIDEEGRGEELGWIVATMRRLESIPVSSEDQLEPDTNTEQQRPENPGANPAASSAQSDFVSAYAVGDDDRLDLASDATVQGSSIPTIMPDDENQDNVDEAGLHQAESPTTNALGAPADNQPLDQASGGVGDTHQQLPNSATNADSNPLHPDYDGPLPPHSQASPASDGSPLPVNGGNPDLNASEPRLHGAISTLQGTSDHPGSDEGFLEKMARWMWGEAVSVRAESHGQAAIDDEHVVQDLANEAPFVPVQHGQPLLDDHVGGGHDEAHEAQQAAPDGEVAADPVQAALEANEVEAVEEVEDLEGIMELVGMQGPMAGLVQNGMFCAVLIALTIFLTIWIPYITGKVFLVVLTNPVSLLVKLPLQWVSSTADLLSDMFIFSLSLTYYWIATTVNILCSPLRKVQLMDRLLGDRDVLAGVAKSYADNALERLTDALFSSTGSISESDIPTFSIVAHESLRMIQGRLSISVERLVSAATAVCTLATEHDTHLSNLVPNLLNLQTYKNLAAQTTLGWQACVSLAVATFNNASTWLAWIRHFDFLRINVALPQRTRPLDFTLAHWDTRDRTLAIVCGYLFFALLGALYLRLGLLLQRKKKAGKVDGVVADVLYQAGGVMKVILIISIEMIVFPLYCGVLLDIALLPLFQNVTLLSRLEFMINSPCTSLFIHWFVGTCYMFHFALFVAMCRKIMRTGVIYFIRDPDDPTFHPVREVLERSVFTQLCKIAFSALVYGGLVIVCLGGVIWGISSAFKGVLPIHWSSNEPVLEFPVDLLFYNFLMPLAMRILRPADGLTKMYEWWFRKCARGLRLSQFLFGERKKDEEGHHVRRRWAGVFSGKQGDVKDPVIGKGRQQLAEDSGLDAYFLRDGKYVRTPASDQVRIPKGVHTFVEVNEAGHRVDGQQDNDEGLHGRKNKQFSTIYIPPHFRLRIGAFIFLLWLFAATTGVSVTVIPLVFGRRVFSHIFPTHPRMNDIYAFSIGISILGSAAYLCTNARRTLHYVRRTLIPKTRTNTSNALRQVLYCALRFTRVLYTYTAFGFLLPTLIALIPEFYIFIPLHTYLGKGTAEHHIVHFVQNWTLGVLYVKVISRLILRFAPARLATALRHILHAGWTDPDIRLATRGFILPGTVLLSFLLLAPLTLGGLANSILKTDGQDARSRVYRYSYPGVLGMVLAGVVCWYAAKAFQKWKRKIRDEVYLIGERLHNFGERRGVPASNRMGTR
ncbi:MAG: hypothetical protein LQ350_007856 [Teloschistes chrysophthalmus]|nr:MAG: hypothetical protein LQ350_007856 [Niorma chrysophthalma]